MTGDALAVVTPESAISVSSCGAGTEVFALSSIGAVSSGLRGRHVKQPDMSNEVGGALRESLESLEGGGNRAGEHGQTSL